MGPGAVIFAMGVVSLNISIADIFWTPEFRMYGQLPPTFPVTSLSEQRERRTSDSANQARGIPLLLQPARQEGGEFWRFINAIIQKPDWYFK